jgi:hypothetical protein
MQSGMSMSDAEAGLTSTNANHVTCWACSVLVEVPLVHGIPAQVFKVGVIAFDGL